MYDRAIQFLCAGAPVCAQDANLMSELAVTLNSNLAACWLRLEEYELAKQHCELAMKFDAHNVKVRYRRALAFLKLGLVEDARKDLEIALKFEPKNKFVLKELKSLEQEYGIKEGTRQNTTHLEKGKMVFDPLHVTTKDTTSTKIGTKGIGEGPSHCKDVSMTDVSEDDLKSSTPINGAKNCSKFQMVSGDNIGSKSGDHREEGGRFQDLCKDKSREPEVNNMVGPDNHLVTSGDMDVDKQSTISTLSQEISGGNSNTMVGGSPAAKFGLNSIHSSDNFKEDDMITFSNPRKPNHYVRLSRKAYQELVEGRPLSYTLASQQDRLCIRALVDPRNLTSPRDRENEKEIISTRGEKEEMVDVEDTASSMEDATSTISSEYSSNINPNLECEIQSVNMGMSNMDSAEEEVCSNSSEHHAKQMSFPFAFIASLKCKGSLRKPTQSRFRYFKTHGCHSTSSASSSSATKICSKSLKSMSVFFCRKQSNGCKGRKRKINYEEFGEDIITKKRSIVNNGLVAGSYTMHAIGVEDECSNTVSVVNCKESMSSVSLGINGGP